MFDWLFPPPQKPKEPVTVAEILAPLTGITAALTKLYFALDNENAGIAETQAMLADKADDNTAEMAKARRIIDKLNELTD